MEDNTNFVLQSGGTTPLGGLKPEKTKSWFSATGPKLGLAALFIIAIVLASHFVSKVRSSQTSGNGGNGSNQRERFTADGISYVVVTNVELTLSDTDWSWPPIVKEANQGLDLRIISGDFKEFLVRDADDPGFVYRSWYYSHGCC